MISHRHPLHWFDIKLLGHNSRISHTLHPLMKLTVWKIHDTLFAYLVIFMDILTRHMHTEYEIQIRDGAVCDHSYPVLRTLNSEHHNFQYKDRIADILSPWTTMLLGQPLQEHAVLLINDFWVTD